MKYVAAYCIIIEKNDESGNSSDSGLGEYQRCAWFMGRVHDAVLINNNGDDWEEYSDENIKSGEKDFALGAGGGAAAGNAAHAEG